LYLAHHNPYDVSVTPKDLKEPRYSYPLHCIFLTFHPFPALRSSSASHASINSDQRPIDHDAPSSSEASPFDSINIRLAMTLLALSKLRHVSDQYSDRSINMPIGGSIFRSFSDQYSDHWTSDLRIIVPHRSVPTIDSDHTYHCPQTQPSIKASFVRGVPIT
jgi:hypothetical protein